MWYLLKNFYKLTVVEENKSFSIKLKNSWKGLIILLLSILYCKVGGKIVNLQAHYNFVHHIRVDHDFQLLNSAIIDGNPIIENLYIPKSYRPIYTLSRYTDNDIIQAFVDLCKALNVDIKKSKVIVEPSNNNIKNFSFVQIKEKTDISNLVCGIFSSCTNEGTAFVTNDTMKSMIDKYRILVAHPIKTPLEIKRYNEENWDCTYPYKFLAYPILKRYEDQLFVYFPLCKESISNYAKKTDKFEYALFYNNNFLELGCDYIVTDFIEMGIWG